jgi:glutamine synthetase
MTANTLKFKSNGELIKFIAGNEIQFIDLNFTDMRGTWQRATEHHSIFNEDTLKKGVFIDGAVLAGSGYKSGMILMPDITSVCLDPFAAQKTIKIFCDVYDPVTGKASECDPRTIARAAEEYLKKSGLGDTVYFGPQAEFFIFEDVKFDISMKRIGFEIDSAEGLYNSARNYETGNNGHRSGVKGAYLREAPVDSLSDIRGEMVTVMQSMGVAVQNHHHKTAPSQCEIGIVYSTLLDCADKMQIYKHVVRNVANSYGKTATFMPVPVHGDHGSGMHCHQSLWKGGKALFAGEGYAGLSETALFYIGGILKHAKALNAFTNPATNSYKRLQPGCGAPAFLAYSSDSNSSACHIPNAGSPNARRIETRFPDGCANPYLAFSVMLMAGLDGIENKIHPGDASSKNFADLSGNEIQAIPKLCGSLHEALHALKADNNFLLKGNVFSADLLNSYIKLKTQEVEIYESTVHPVEYQMYYSS